MTIYYEAFLDGEQWGDIMTYEQAYGLWEDYKADAKREKKNYLGKLWINKVTSETVFKED